MTDLNDFLARKARSEAKDQVIAQWHIAAHVDGGIPLPYSHDDTWINVNVYGTGEDGSGYELDAEKSIAALARIAAYVSKLSGLTVEKNYRDSDFQLIVSLPDDGPRIRYSANRDAVCTKRVIGSKTIPEQITPAREEEIVEWDCEPVSLLAIAKDEDSA